MKKMKLFLAYIFCILQFSFSSLVNEGDDRICQNSSLEFNTIVKNLWIDFYYCSNLDDFGLVVVYRMNDFEFLFKLNDCSYLSAVIFGDF